MSIQENNPAVEAIAFALETDDGMEFLRYWNQGDFDVIRSEWPEAPEAVFIGADTLHPSTMFDRSGTCTTGLADLPERGFQCVDEQGIKVFFGSIPISELATHLAGCPDDWVISPGLGRLVGASMLVGSPEGIDRYRAKAKPGPARRAEVQAVMDAGLSVAAVKWVLCGDRGASSDALFAACTGVDVGGRTEGRAVAPSDRADFERCASLQENVPECASVFPAAMLSPLWTQIVAAWPRLLVLRGATAEDRVAHAEILDILKARC